VDSRGEAARDVDKDGIMQCMVVESRRSQMLKGLLDPCILAVIATEEAYGYEIVRRLTVAGLGDVAEGSAYPALARLERGGLLASRRVESDSGPPRKYYRLTPSGRATLEEWTRDWRKLSVAVSTVLGASPAPGKE